VRRIDEKSFKAICKADLDRPKKKNQPTKLKKIKQVGSSGSQKASAQVIELAHRLAVAEAKTQWPEAKIFVSPSEGAFSIVVRIAKGHERHIAVKGTNTPEPLVRLTSDEILFSTSHAATFSLWIFYDLNLLTGTGRFVNHDGALTEKDFDLQAAVHGGRLRKKRASNKVGPIRD
jgi:hypothetical protein